jgi:hypothetical protein
MLRLSLSFLLLPLLLGSKLGPSVMGRISFLKLDDEIPKLVMLFVKAVSSPKLRANVGHSFFTPVRYQKQDNTNELILGFTL